MGQLPCQNPCIAPRCGIWESHGDVDEPDVRNIALHLAPCFVFGNIYMHASCAFCEFMEIVCHGLHDLGILEAPCCLSFTEQFAYVFDSTERSLHLARCFVFVYISAIPSCACCAFVVIVGHG